MRKKSASPIASLAAATYIVQHYAVEIVQTHIAQQLMYQSDMVCTLQQTSKLKMCSAGHTLQDSHAAATFAMCSSMPITSLPRTEPDFFGHFWSSSVQPFAPAAMNCLMVRCTFSTLPPPVAHRPVTFAAGCCIITRSHCRRSTCLNQSRPLDSTIRDTCWRTAACMCLRRRSRESEECSCIFGWFCVPFLVASAGQRLARPATSPRPAGKHA